MKQITIVIIYLFTFWLSISLFSTIVKADVMNPEYLTKKCGDGEKEIVCSYKSKEPFGPHTEDECAKYKNNSNYYYLVGHGSSFGGRQKYCLKVGAEDNAKDKSGYSVNNNYAFTAVVITVVTAVSLLALLVIRKKNVEQ